MMVAKDYEQESLERNIGRHYEEVGQYFVILTTHASNKGSISLIENRCKERMGLATFNR